MRSDSTVLLNQVTRGMAVNTQKSLPRPLSHGMVQCFLDVSLWNSDNAEKLVFMNLKNGAWWQKNYFPLWKQNSCSLKPSRKKHSFISPHYNSCDLIFEYSERNMLLAILCWDVMRHTVSPTQSKNWHGKEYSKTSFLMEWHNVS